MAKNAVQKGSWKAKGQEARKKLSLYRREERAQVVPNAMAGVACTLGGAAAAGAVQAYADDIMGIPSPVVLGLISFGIGAGVGGNMGKTLICASGGMLAGYVAETVENSMAPGGDINQFESNLAGAIGA